MLFHGFADFQYHRQGAQTMTTRLSTLSTYRRDRGGRGSVGRDFTYCVRIPRSDGIKLSMAVQEDQNLKVLFGYTSSLRAAWTT